MKVKEVDYLPIKRAMLEVVRAHYYATQSDPAYRKELTEVLFDFLEYYAARIASNPNTAYTIDIPALFETQGLTLEE